MVEAAVTTQTDITPKAVIGDDAALQARVDAMVAFFKKVHFEQMFGMPVCNNALEVEAVDFQRLERDGRKGWVGCLITPWFLKYFYLPDGDDPWAGKAVGDRVKFAFPAGELTCFVDRLEGFGSYISYSLYSPMPDFKTQESARLTAREAMYLVFEEPEAEPDQAPEPEHDAGEAPKDNARRDALRALLGRGRS